MKDKIDLTWSNVETYINKLLEHLKQSNINPSGVYGIPRGGLILSTLVSYKLDIPLLTAPCNNCIVIDDIADSGRTLLHFTSNDTQFNKYFITTMYYHKRSMVKPNFYLYEKVDEWITFPWEK